MINIAIDGPSGAGKSTIAKAAAKKLGYIYVDTGALYRTIALNAIRKGADVHDENALQEVLKDTDVKLAFVEDTQHVFLNGEDVSEFIRTPEISMGASAVSALPCVRAFLLDLQRNIASKNNCIMDGRDIGTLVLPNAQIKIFLTASSECRAKRRYIELLERGHEVEYDDVLKDIIERDYNDSHRDIAPLKPSDDSVILNTTEMDLQQSIDALVDIVEKRI